MPNPARRPSAQGYGDPFAGGDRRGVADNGHQFAMATRLGSEDAEAVFGIMECNPLDQASDDLGAR